MNRQSHWAVRPRGARARSVLLVLAVLAGLVAMHGLGPVHHPGTDHAAPAAGHSAHMMAAAPADGSCAHADGGTSGHLGHADPTCAAVGTSGSPVLPGLSPTGTTPAGAAPAMWPTPAEARGSRAPPSLSELQLLRI